VKVGDLVHSIDGIAPTRETLWKLLYLYTTLRYQNWVRLVIESPGGQTRQLDVKTKVWENKEEKHLIGSSTTPDPEYIKERKLEIKSRHNQTKEVGDDLFVWKMPVFVMPEEEIDDTMKKVRQHKALILDLRGNPGGRVGSLLRMVDNFFADQVKVADRKGRKEMKPQTAKGRGDKAFKGKLVVLVDSESGSAAELFARVIQLEKRGTVVGDRSAGAVMESIRYGHFFNRGGSVFNAAKVFYGMSITDADLLMADGKSLERVGVTPDEIVLPTGADLAARRDPVMSRAAELVGVKLSPMEAGKLFDEEKK
jgi:C-terminal processing protease CtpA/Prc